jgi:Flp pilus assembly protein TadD
MNGEQLFEQAAIAARDGMPDRALELLAHALITDPTHADAWALRGRIEHMLGRNFNALLHYDSAVALAPHRFDLWSNRGIVCGRLLMWQDAEASFKRSIEINPQQAQPHMNLAEQYIIQMRLDEAEKHAIEAVRISADPHARTKLGVIWIAGGWAATSRSHSL